MVLYRPVGAIGEGNVCESSCEHPITKQVLE